MAGSLLVSVVAGKEGTITALREYLSGAGVVSQSPRLCDPDAINADTTAAVVFPDEFVVSEVVAWIVAARVRYPRLLIVLVTSTPQHFRAASSPDGHSLLPLILPKPSFGWTILDAIRERAH